MNYSEKYKKIIDELVEYDFEKKPASLSDFLQEKIFTEDTGIQLLAPKDNNDVIAYFDEKVNSSEHLLFDVLEFFSILKVLIKQEYIFIIPFINVEGYFSFCSYRKDLVSSINHSQSSDAFIRINSNERIYHKGDFRWVDNNNNRIYKEYKISSYSCSIKEYLHSTVVKTGELELLKKNEYKSESVYLNIIAQRLMIISIYLAFANIFTPFFQYLFQFNWIYQLLILLVNVLVGLFLYLRYW